MRNEICKTEQDYYDKLTTDEKRIYEASNEELAMVSTWNDYWLKTFVDIARQLNELHRLHDRYNEIQEQLLDMPNHTDDLQKDYEELYSVNEELFSYSISIGTFATVLDLSVMDECDPLYEYLCKVKMNRFDYLADNFDIAVLIETLELNDL
jgi:DNA repair exonuclease SbcCD ATPase subunit